MASVMDIKPRKRITDIRRYSFLIYGKPGCGKTYFASNIPNALILSTEDGGKGNDGVMDYPIRSWSDFQKVIDELSADLKATRTKFGAVVVDTADNLIQFVQKEALSKHDTRSEKDIELMEDVPWSGGYRTAQAILLAGMLDLQKAHPHVFFLSHAKSIDSGDGAGTIEPTISGSLGLIVKGGVNIVGCAIKKQKGPETIRSVHFENSMRFDTKDQSGILEHYTSGLPLDYSALKAAFAEAEQNDSKE